MIKHIVMWNFAEQAEGADKAANLATVKAALDGLKGLVPGMGAFEAVVGSENFPHSYDLILYSEFETEQAHQAYATHPDHVAVATFIGKVRSARVVFDYEV